MSDHDIVIVGAGVIGLMTAYHLTNHGCKPTILEQFSLPHTRGSSHGQSRLLHAHGGKPAVTRLVQESMQEWRQLEALTGETLLQNVGLMNVHDSRTSSLCNSLINSLDQCRSSYDVLDGSRLRDKLLMLKYSQHHVGVLEHGAGVLMADRVIRTLLELVIKRGVKIEEGTKVVDIQPGSTIQLRTNRGHMTCHRLVMCPGPWAPDLFKLVGLHNLPVKTMPGLHCFWKVSNPDQFTSSNCPVIYHPLDLSHNPSKNRFFLLFPVDEYPGMIKFVSRGEPPPFYCHPDDREESSMQEMIDLLAAYGADHVPGMATQPSIVEPCMYCVTPGRQGYVDKHPKYSNIIVGTAFSGRGFMVSPVIGKALTQLVLGESLSFDISDYSLTRFEHSKL